MSIVTVVQQGLAKVMENTHVEQCASKALNVTVRSARPREYLTEREIDRLIEAAKGNRWGHRDATAILLAYRHGLRASELVALRWDDIDFRTSKLHVRRAKRGTASVHPLRAKELRALCRLLRETPEVQRATYLFVSERMAPLSVAGYQRATPPSRWIASRTSGGTEGPTHAHGPRTSPYQFNILPHLLGWRRSDAAVFFEARIDHFVMAITS